MSKVYLKSINPDTPVQEIQAITQELLKTLVEKENIQLRETVPLKVHFGEKGNVTYLKSDNFIGIIDYLKQQNIDTRYMETTVMYGGQRYRKDLHLKTAAEHGFDQIPIHIADGEQGELYDEITIHRKHFKTCKIGKDFSDFDQMIVLSHFKGHTLAGFGGAMKQLSMGCASKGGKLEMHMGIKPKISNRKCKKCDLCLSRCNEDAITIGEKKSFIDHDKCVGCGACLSICPHKAVSIMSLSGIYSMIFERSDFYEKLMEYAYAALIGKSNISINFAMNITKGCDCEPRKMKPIMDDFGILISSDPLAIDKACYDMVKERGKAFRGFKQFEYAESIGLGSTNYEIVEI